MKKTTFGTPNNDSNLDCSLCDGASLEGVRQDMNIIVSGMKMDIKDSVVDAANVQDCSSLHGGSTRSDSSSSTCNRSTCLNGGVCSENRCICPERFSRRLHNRIVDGFLEFSYELGSGPAQIQINNVRVDDGKRHQVVLKRQASDGSIDLDSNYTEFGESGGILKMLNTRGNIYIGGVPNFDLMTAGRYLEGFAGCIHSLQIQSSGDINLRESALSAVNALPCSKPIQYIKNVGKRPQGRPRKRWEEQITESMQVQGEEWKQLKEKEWWKHDGKKNKEKFRRVRLNIQIPYQDNTTRPHSIKDGPRLIRTTDRDLDRFELSQIVSADEYNDVLGSLDTISTFVVERSEFLATDPEVPGSIAGTSRFSVKHGVDSASRGQIRSYLNKEVAVPVYKTEINS
ncbi:unnamed protein product [Timema podura]|uniref:Laminin G domain-containing protein n=1 Tax=Timema podura TaxID=61482 RepID=A0ABN7NGL7_TIMPD|nr:unnamed protein product [Timema podura]